MRYFKLFVAGLCLCSSKLPLRAADESIQPNVIFILCDDLGYGDIGALREGVDAPNEKFFRTPHLDQMAADGAILSQHYCPAPVCAPSRASLLLGQHQGNCAIRDNQFDKALPGQPTIATVLKQAGYTTAIVGKYGLQGDQRYAMEKDGTKPSEWPAYPTKRGFDEFFGYVRHVDGHVHYPADRWELGNSETHKSPKELWHNDNEISGDLENCYTTDLFTAYAKHWIAKHKSTTPDKPFFLYLAYDTPHAALQVPSCEYPDGSGANGGVQWTGQSGRMINTATGPIDSYRHPETIGKGWTDVEERFATMVRRIDDGVGDLLQTLDDLGVSENTLVVLSSDNGPHHESYLASSQYDPTSFQSYGPFDGTKRDTWEGGIRVPTIAHWPARIPADTIDESPSQFHDWMATFADVAGAPVPALCDGVSLVASMTGSGEREPSTIYVEYNQNGRTQKYADFDVAKQGRKRGQMQVIHLDRYKGVRVDIQSHEDNFQIYDLKADPKELSDLAETSDEMRILQQRMRDRVLQLRRSNDSAPRPFDDDFVPAAGEDDSEQGIEFLAAYTDVVYVGMAGGGATVNELQSYDEYPRVWGNDRVFEIMAQVLIPEDGTYRFSIRTEQPAVMRMHEFVLIDNATDHTGGLTEPVKVKLKAGLHPIRLHLLRIDGGLQYELHWAAGDQPMQKIPVEAIRKPASNADPKRD